MATSLGFLRRASDGVLASDVYNLECSSIGYRVIRFRVTPYSGSLPVNWLSYPPTGVIQIPSLSVIVDFSSAEVHTPELPTVKASYLPNLANLAYAISVSKITGVYSPLGDSTAILTLYKNNEDPTYWEDIGADVGVTTAIYTV